MICDLFILFQLYLVEELVSPLVTPFMLMFKIRHKSQEIVDFYRNFTVEVTGVGDVCSFALMDIRRHAHPHWTSIEDGDGGGGVEEEGMPTSTYCPAEGGKTEMSLVHFTVSMITAVYYFFCIFKSYFFLSQLTNPEWKPPESSTAFIKNLKDQG